MQGIPPFFLFCALSEMKPLQAFDYSNNSFTEHWKVFINLTINFRVHKNKSDCREAINPDHFSTLEKHKLNRIIDVYKALHKIQFKHSIFLRSDR